MPKTLATTRPSLARHAGLSADFVGLGRALVAGLLAIPTLLALRHPPPPIRLLPRLALVATGVVLGYPILTALALVHVPATHGSVITGLLPAIMAVLRANERPSATFWLAATAVLACVIATQRAR